MMKLFRSTFLILLICGLGCAQSTDSNSTSSRGTITGRVTQHGKALADVIVKAWRKSSSRPTKDALEVKTDLEGFYRINSVPAANYYVAAYRAGLVPVQDGDAWVSPKAVSISTDETASGIDFQLVGGGVITGRVTNGNGQPLSEELIILIEARPQPNPTLSFPNPSMMELTSGIFKTDDRGVYRVFGIPPGAYKVSVGAHFPAFTSFRGQPAYRRAFYPGTNDEARARVIEVREDSVAANIDINVGSLVPTYSARGRIIDSVTAQPVSGVGCDIRIAGATGGGEIPGAGISNDKGEFKLSNLPAGRYSVRISERRQRNGDSTDFFGESPLFDIGDADISGIEVRATRTSGVSGAVVVANTNDRTVLAKAAQLSLSFQTIPAGRDRIGFESAKPESDMSFSISGLRPGRLRIRLNSEEQGAAVGLRFLRMELPDSTPVREAEIKAGERREGLRVVLVYGASSVRGFVKLQNGALPADGKVHARITNDQGFYAGMWVDNQGTFLIEAVPAGVYTLIVSAEVPGKRTLGPEARQPISVAEGQVSQTSIILDLARLQPGP
jgi:hypothetical protein